MYWEQIKYCFKRNFTEDLLKENFLKTGKYNFPQLAQVNYFDGLPLNSTVAVTTNTLYDKEEE